MNKCFDFVINLLKNNEIAFEVDSEAISGFRVIVLSDFRFCFRLISLKDYFQANVEPSFFVENKVFKNKRVINLWEDECACKPQIIASRINGLLGKNQKIPARLCVVKRINQEQAKLFLNQNHLQGSTKAKIKLGLFLKPQYNTRFGFEGQEDVLLSVATFAACRNLQKEHIEWKSAELIRVATLLNISVIGGLDKILTNYQREFLPNDMITYTDNDWSVGEGFVKIGFHLEKEIEAIGFAINLGTLERISLAKPTNELLLQCCEVFPSDSLNVSAGNTLHHHYFTKIYNAGSMKFRREFFAVELV
jgi:hypothetical protein